ncbi:MAG: gliding motility-associated ABC transporter permease subunit GldF [Chitinophagales bacterium]|nr:gliding motility-associated ABC transporter permease subunit GldF [Bacteroidota bacterium]MBK9556360.1 gliding motility-associated ABC transporter permease subunit GldF [Bacteroidota bacterium]MBL0280797.1 gliding motility-associated ABC transporter permease subunit GldF [Bacteroidota bacterium]MBP8248673.1 gliding motility-associated ABC transporter permease subunit GldF [Chitinophagales bacterium]MBP9879536.1 gliding motility-associated ABC transporter permease subunit GldF [Chitinophagale
MIAIFRKELNVFFSSLIGYIAITIFLIANGLFAWVFPETNILDDGYATLDSFFNFAPWILMFLIPAITMRSFAEEKNSGTIEFITTRPITDMQIIFGKYLAALVLVIFAVLPTVLYYFTVSALASPAGNVDTGGIIGSYIGLILLGATFVSIALFTSSITNNQIVAFIAGMFACFFFYLAFDSLSLIPAFIGTADKYFNAISINRHYLNISKGYIDLRDVIYFSSMIGIFILMTKTALGSRKW